MAKAIIDMADETTGHVIAFCGNDKILESTEHRLLLEMDRNVRSRIGLIGYDGARNTTGDLMAFGGVMALATVDLARGPGKSCRGNHARGTARVAIG